MHQVLWIGNLASFQGIQTGNQVGCLKATVERSLVILENVECYDFAFFLILIFFIFNFYFLLFDRLLKLGIKKNKVK